MLFSQPSFLYCFSPCFFGSVLSTQSCYAIASMIAFNVGLGRITLETFASSG